MNEYKDWQIYMGVQRYFILFSSYGEKLERYNQSSYGKMNYTLSLVDSPNQIIGKVIL